MADPSRAAAIVLLLAVPLAGCIGFDGPEGDCSSQHAYADRLVFDQAGLYAAMGEAFEEANRSAEASWSSEPQGVWAGARGQIETVSVDGRVHGVYDASPEDDVPFRTQDSVLADYGPLWLDSVHWMPNGTLEQQLSYHAPDHEDDQSFVVHFRASNLSEAAGAEHARTLHQALFPGDSYEPLEDPDFATAWIRNYERHPQAPVDADGLLADLIDAGGLEHREAPFEGIAFPHTLGTLHLEAHDIGDFSGELALRLGHDLRAIAAGNDPTLVLEVTPADRATLANLGSAPLGEDELAQAADERFGNVTGLPDLALDQASHEEGGEVTVSTEGGCSAMDALGEPLLQP